MDASNPVISSDRMSVAAILDRSLGVRRQDLRYLGELAAGASRTLLSVRPPIPEQEVRKVVSQYLIPKVDSVKSGDLDPKIFEKISDGFPVCGVMDAIGVPLHPPGINQSKGKVSVNRVMGQTAGIPKGLIPVAETFGDEVLEREHVYTSGTWSGFMNRLSQQMGRKTVSLLSTMSKGNKPVNMRTGIKMLDKYLPRRANLNWAGLHTNLADAILEGITITANASAGAPYWRNKGECMDHIVDVGLPMVVRALKENKLQELYREQPEFFLCEVKNKLDRYAIKELDQKTRPYTCVPAHWAFLFSVLSQGFQETLDLFTDNGESSNAYGFSSTNGGLKKMVDWMRTADKRGKVVVYGDDATIVVKTAKGTYRVDPDFKQMDGSIHEDDVRLTIAWILSHAERDTGEEQKFWRGVADVWRTMATNPDFVIDGTTVYRKKQPNGLMTGVPGTTLFDTVKSAVAWNVYLDDCFDQGLDPLDGDRATKEMAKMGLVLKPGTWNPALIPESRDGQLMTDHKFLGIQILCKEWNGELVYLPTIPEKDALEMLLVQKDSPFEKSSITAKQRMLYDRMRGLTITIGFTIPTIQDAINRVVNSIPGEVIIMQTQIPTGERPEHITLQDFNYPDSTGFPSYDFCCALYSGRAKADHGWIQLYPSLVETLQDLRAERRVMGRRLRLAMKHDEEKISVRVVPPPDPPLLEGVMEQAVAVEKPDLPTGSPNPRSKIICYEGGKITERKVVPTRGQTLLSYLNHRSGITSMWDAANDLNLTPELVRREADKYGFYVTGAHPDDLISLNPIVTPFKTDQEVLVEKWQANQDLIDKGTSSRRERLIALNNQRVVQTAPRLVRLDIDMLVALPRLEPATSANDALMQLNPALNTLFGGMKWVTMPERGDSDNPVGVQLWVGPPGDIELCAEAWSISSKLAKTYVARAIFDINNISYPGPKVDLSNINVRYEDPPPDVRHLKWSKQEELERESETPYRVPRIEPMSDESVEWPMELALEFPKLSGAVIELAYRVALSRIKEKGYPDDALAYASRLLQHFGHESSSSGASRESKRSRLSSVRKAKDNRKRSERRKRAIVRAKTNP